MYIRKDSYFVAKTMKKLLLVEDDSFIVDIYSSKFKQEGYDVDIAPDGEMALEKLKNNLPDLLILDLVVPKIDGWGVLRSVRNDPKTKDLKVIIISNLDRKSYPDDADKLGVAKYFLKIESTPEEIANQIKEILK